MASSPIWFITGASSGFGKAMAAEALRRGHKVIAAARNTSAMADLEKAGAFVLSLDVTADDATICAKAKEANTVFGGITHLANCAGYQLEGMVEEASTQEVYDIFNVNVFGTLKTIRAILPYMRETSAPDKVIANFGSTASWTAWPSCSMYCSTKWAVSGMTEGLASEVAPFGIKAVVVEPGIFRTDVLSLSGRRVQAQKHIAEYKEMRDMMNGNMALMHGTQLGDVNKAAVVILDVLARKSGKEIPLRILLGPDSVDTVGNKCRDTLALIEEWSDVIKSTDHDV